MTLQEDTEKLTTLAQRRRKTAPPTAREPALEVFRALKDIIKEGTLWPERIQPSSLVQLSSVLSAFGSPFAMLQAAAKEAPNVPPPNTPPIIGNVVTDKAYWEWVLTGRESLTHRLSRRPHAPGDEPRYRPGWTRSNTSDKYSSQSAAVTHYAAYFVLSALKRRQEEVTHQPLPFEPVSDEQMDNARFDLLPTPQESEELLEQDQGGGTTSPWWAPEDNDTQWLGPVWAWWWVKTGIQADRWHFYDIGRESSPYPDVGLIDVANDITKCPVWISEVPTLQRDHVPARGNELKICVVRGDFQLVKSVEAAPFSVFNESCPEPSPFAFRPSKTPWPGSLVAHVALVDNEGWLLLNRRSSRRTKASYMVGLWSASYEEHVDLYVDGSLDETIIRGAGEELNAADKTDQHNEKTLVVAMGREAVPIEDETVSGRFVLNGAAIATAVSRFQRRKIWERSRGFMDVKEHDAWAAVRFRDVAQADAFIAATEHPFALRTVCRSLEVDLEWPETRTRGSALDDKRGFHPTSALRIVSATCLGRGFPPPSTPSK